MKTQDRKETNQSHQQNDSSNAQSKLGKDATQKKQQSQSSARSGKKI